MRSNQVANPTRRKAACGLAVLLLISTACSEPASPDGSGTPWNPPPVPPPFMPAPPSPPPPQRGQSSFIWTSDIFDGDIRPLVEGERPAWSPDGKRLLFERGGFVRIINADGTGEGVVASGAQASWSPDSKRVVMVRPEGIVTILDNAKDMSVVVRHDFRKDTHAPGDMGVGKPSWSPDGRTIAFEHLGDGATVTSQIFVVNVDGSALRRLTSGVGCRESDPAWSPADSRIAYWSSCTGISVADPDGGVRSLSTMTSLAYGARPAWSPDGQRLFFVADFAGQGASVWQILSAGGVPGIYITQAFDPVWAPDGVHIAFASRTLIP